MMDTDEKSTERLLSSDDQENETLQDRVPRSSWKLALICTLCGLLPAFVVWLVMSQSSRVSGHIEMLHKTPIPDFPTEMRVFEWNYTFAGVRSPESEHAWRSLLPFGRGYVLIDDPSTYDLPPTEGEETSNGTIYSVALYHQLHCLTVIRRDYFDLVEGVLNNITDVAMLVDKQIQMFHNRHCLDYIRQTLECIADMTLEWKRTELDGSRIQVDGMHIPHECKSRECLLGKIQKYENVLTKGRMLSIIL